MTNHEAKAGAAGQVAPQGQATPTNYSSLQSTYANFCRVSATPEELVLDFGLNTQLTPDPSQPVKMAQRVVLSYYTAKRLLSALAGFVGQHEAVYGTLELDLMRRVRGSARPVATGGDAVPAGPRVDELSMVGAEA